MEKIECLVWSNDLSRGEEGNALTAHYLEKASALVEAEINETGGIAGTPLTIKCQRVPSGEKGVEEILERLKSSPDIVFLNGHTQAALNERLFEAIDLDAYAIFAASGLNRVKHPNLFNISRVSQNTKIQATRSLLEKYDQETRILFLHDGRRTAEKEIEFLTPELNNSRSINFSDFQKEGDIRRELGDILSDLKNDDVLILDVGLRVFRHIFDHLNETGKQTQVIKLFGSIEGRFERINFPLVEITNENVFPYLDLADLIRRVDIPSTPIEMEWIKEVSWRLEIPLLVAHATRNCSFVDRPQLLAKMGAGLNEIDGDKDIFVGKQLAYAFRENINILKTNYLYQFPASLQHNNTFSKLFCPGQYYPHQDHVRSITINFVLIDVLRVSNIHIGNGTWGCEFYLDIVTPHEDPLQIINFNNLSSVTPKFEAKNVWRKKTGREGEISYRYYVVANFDFAPLADNYPFDSQHIYIGFSISDQERYGVIQPIPDVLLDREFDVDGWTLNDATSGILRKKETIFEGSGFKTRVEIREEARIGWALGRKNSVTVMKLGIPLFFLLFLNYYTLYRGFDEIGGSIGILTTAFLSGIALYFSSERPQPLRMTTVDLIFLFYYVLTGLTIISTAIASLLSDGFYDLVMLGLKLAIPISFVIFAVYVSKRIKSNRLKPRIN